MSKTQDVVNTTRKKTFKQKKITEFLKEYSDNNLLLNDERIKLCSSDDFNELSASFKDLLKQKSAPTMISQVGGFYVMASLAGFSASHSKTKPTLFFFDRKRNNIANAIYNTLLMQACDSKEDYVLALFGLDNKDVVKALDSTSYNKYITQVYEDEYDDDVSDKKELQKKALAKYKKESDKFDSIIEERYDLSYIANRCIEENFNISKLEKYAKDMKYDKDKHYKVVMDNVKDKLTKEYEALFTPIAASMADYLAKGDNYNDLVTYLSKDMQLNSESHILCNNDVYEGYKSLINKKGQSSVKFVPGIDISTDSGVNKLEKILDNEKIINPDDSSKFTIDIAFLPHIDKLTNSYKFIKKHVEKFININRGGTDSFAINSTAKLNVRTYDSIGASFIEEGRKKRKALTHLTPIKKEEKGFPLLTFIGGTPIGNIYNSEEDLYNVIDMAIADKVDTVYVQGLIYSTYYHNQTDRRMLIDPKYQTLDQRLKAAKKIIKKLNDNGIKVVYQMGVEEYYLYQDMFTIYTREQGVKGNNFLAREDKKSAFDWVRPIIIQKLIPYLIRSGEDVTNFYTDDEQKTRVSELCHALKNQSEGLPLGELSKFIKEEYLVDTDMFRVVYSTIDQYGEDKATSVNLLSNPSLTPNAQPSNPTRAVNKKINLHQTGGLSNKLEEVPQLFVDASKAMMHIAYNGDQVAMNVPQMVDDSKYIEHPELLSGIKENIISDPTHKRVTNTNTRPSYPGSWTITGDARELMSIIPYYKRTREVMEYVNKTGKGLEEVDVFYLNDIQLGSLTERLEYTIKAMDYFFYHYPNPKGIWGNGDFQHGWNYGSYANECRHTGAASVAQQMIDFIKLFKPYFQETFGVVRNDLFVGDYDDYKIDEITSNKIFNHLNAIGAIKSNQGKYSNFNLVIDGLDYKTLDLQLPQELIKYESVIRAKLVEIKIFKFIHLAEGNHEYNTDWDKKGYNLIKTLKEELDTYKEITGSDIEIAQSEFFVNKKGDIVQSPVGCKTINGYNIVYSHLYKSASGDTPILGMSKFFNRMGEFSNEIHRAHMGHLHIFGTGVIDNKLYSITGSGAGQSGFEQSLGLSSRPLFVVDRYLPDGRIAIDTIGTELLKQYKVQNPLIKEIGLENFINACLTEEAAIYGFNGTPKDIQPVHQRKLVIGQPNKIVGPEIG